jgi:hypothetical protein
MNSSLVKSFGGLLLAGLLLAALPFGAAAQSLNVGSDGSDGALNLTTSGTVDFFSLPNLDSNGDGVYNFTSVNISSGVTLNMTGTIRGPVVWLSQGDVNILGTINLTGRSGHGSSTRFRAMPGAGGFSGGLGFGGSGLAATDGSGPGAGKVLTPAGVLALNGGHAGHAVTGTNATDRGAGGAAYGNDFLLPLMGGSGGAGDPDTNCGGGAGGGAILIASSTRINFGSVGNIQAYGGTSGCGGAGNGSGGEIRLVAPTIVSTSSSAQLNVSGFTSSQAPGRIRLEAFQNSFTGSTFPGHSFSAPGPIRLPVEARPVQIVSIDGVPVPANPGGGFNPADLSINQGGTSVVQIEGRGVPLGTVVKVTVISDTVAPVVANSTPLSGSLALSTATANVAIPSGFSQIIVQADF